MKKITYIITGLIVVFAFTIITPATTTASAPDKGTLKKVTFVHHPHPGQEFAKPDKPGKPDKGDNGKPVPQCEVTTNDSIDNWGATGWYMPISGITYQVNTSKLPSNINTADFLAVYADATQTWSQVDNGINWNYGGTTTAKRATYDGVNLVSFGSAKGAIAITTTWYWTGTGEVAETDIILSSGLDWSITDPNSGDCGGVVGTYDVQDIVTHELGHQVGLVDLYSSADKDLTMYGYGLTAELKKNSLGTGDITGAQTVSL